MTFLWIQVLQPFDRPGTPTILYLQMGDGVTGRLGFVYVARLERGVPVVMMCSSFTSLPAFRAFPRFPGLAGSLALPVLLCLNLYLSLYTDAKRNETSRIQQKGPPFCRTLALVFGCLGVPGGIT